MENKPENPLAFPSEREAALGRSGMTLRDYFAAKVLQAQVSILGSLKYRDEKTLAIISYNMVDAMLAARQS